MLKRIIFSLIAGLLFFPAVSLAQYSDNDLLIETMVEKGYLSPVEAQILKEKTKEYVAKHMEEGRLITLPEWIQRIELKGDVRLRSQFEKRKGTAEGRHRGRLSARLGLVTKLHKQFSAGIGMATSDGGDPRSTMINFTDSFERADVRLDYAYIQYQPGPWLKIIGGQFSKEDYLWTPTDYLWDGDINPQGGSVHLEKTFGDFFKVFASGGSWVLDEITNSPEDPAVTYVQPGINIDSKYFDTTIAGNYFNFHHLRDRRLDNTSCSNSGLTLIGTNCTGSLDYNFRITGPSAEFGFKQPINGVYKRIALFGDYYQNDWALKKLNKAWGYGIKLGDVKVGEAREWQLKYQFSEIKQDAIPDILPDSDRHEGQTGVRGYKGSLLLGLSKNVTLGFEYYNDELIKPELRSATTTEEPQSLYKADLTVKF